ncbi:MAG TPA: aspartyl protease family protein [Thermoanaerobaculia bacterium]|jgi:hypothetical protein
MIELPFEKVTTDRFGLIYEPTIPVAIEGPRGSADVFMIIDSGADISLIPFSVGEYIGLDLDITQRRDVRGIGESSVAYILSDVRLRIGDIVLTARIAWSLTDDVPLILGRLDVFRELVIEFREFEDKIVIERAGA